MYRQRLLTQRLRELADAFPVVVLSGARQVGKSTLLQHLYGDKADIVVFDPVVDVGNARQDPELFLANNRPPLILDEVQYAPELIASLKREIDKDRSPGQYILSGSQQWSVLTSVSESLAGRAAFLDLEGFSQAEAAGSEGSWLANWMADPARFLASPPSPLQDTRTFYESLWRGGPAGCHPDRRCRRPGFPCSLSTHLYRAGRPSARRRSRLAALRTIHPPLRCPFRTGGQPQTTGPGTGSNPADGGSLAGAVEGHLSMVRSAGVLGKRRQARKRQTQGLPRGYRHGVPCPTVVLSGVTGRPPHAGGPFRDRGSR